MALDIPLPYLLLRTSLPYFWRLLWLELVVLFGNLALGILAAMTLAWAYSKLVAQQRPVWARSMVVGTLALCLLQPVLAGALPFRHSQGIQDGPRGAEAAALLERVRTSPEVEVVFSFRQALHLQEQFEKPVSAPKWSCCVSCNNQTVHSCGGFFDSFVEIPEDKGPIERLRLGLCYLQQTGTTHLLFFPREMITHSLLDRGSEEEAVLQAQQEEVRATLRQIADPVDSGGGVDLFRLRSCKETPRAKASGLGERD